MLLMFFLATVAQSQTAYTFDEGLKAAKSGGKKIFVDIYSPSDSWSKKMDSDIFSSKKIQNELSNFVFVKLNAEGTEKYNYGNKSYSAAELAKQFGGTGYPTFVVMNPDGSIVKFKYNGEMVSSLSGFIGESDFGEVLNYFMQGNYDIDISTVFKN